MLQVIIIIVIITKNANCTLKEAAEMAVLIINSSSVKFIILNKLFLDRLN